MEIVNLRASLNLGLSKNLNIYFPKATKIERPATDIPITIDYNWLAGFFSGDGCFFIDIFKSKSSKINYAVKLRALISQHSRDELLINALVNILGYSTVSKHSKINLVTFTVAKFEDVYGKIIPLFYQYQIEGVKLLDFKDFCEAAKLVNKKAHLTLEGLEQIRSIKSRMNLARYKKLNI